jgi:hypothetical protein
MQYRFWRIGFILLWGVIAIAREESYLPTQKQIQTFRDRSDCSIYSAIRGRTMRRYRELLSAQVKIKQIAKQRREALVLCGAPSEASRRALQDDELASRCPGDYQEWLKTGESYLINQAEMNETYRNLQSLAGLISYQCGRVPEVPESLPAEPTPAEKPS